MKIVVFSILLVIVSCESLGHGFDAALSDPKCGQVMHISEEEIARLSPPAAMDQMVLEQMFHSTSINDQNYNALHQRLVDHGKEILPRAVEFLIRYDPADTTCVDRRDAQLLTAAIYLNLIDSAKIRLRADESGRAAITALEAAIGRKKAYRDGKSDGSLLTTLLNQTKGLSIKDYLIQRELRDRFKVNISDDELAVFTNYLISLDPAYPEWTNVIGSAEMAPEEAAKYFDAYKKFKKRPIF